MKRNNSNLFSNLVKCLNAKVDFDQVTTFKDHKKASAPVSSKAQISKPKSTRASRLSLKASSGKKRA